MGRMGFSGRGTRFGEFSPVGRLFHLVNLIFISEKSYISGLLFSLGNIFEVFFTKMDWAKFWAIFEQTHLVTVFSGSRLIL
jgi:hypothetical protein